ncbi:MAG: hypothetical protein NVSMB19_23070 [Vulcanimicrobiaceae bacterium]
MRAVFHTLATIAVGQGAQILAGIATARAFGPAGKGIISYAGVFVYFAAAATEGLRNALAYRVGHDVPVRTAWRSALRLLAVLAPLGSLIFVALWIADPTQIAFAFVALVFPFAAFLQTVNMLYLVRHAIERINVQNAYTVGAGSALVTLVAVALFHASVPTVLAIWAAGFVAASVWAACGVARLLGPRETAPNAGPDALDAREHIAYAFKGGASAMLTLLALRVDILIIGATLAKSSLGVYTTALAVGELLYTFSRSVTWATTGRIATEPRPAAIALTARVVRLLLGVQALAAIAIFALGPYAIAALYGGRFAGSGLLLQILLPRIVVYSADGVISYFISVREGRPGVQLAFEAGTLVLCATLTYVAIKPYGLTGAAAAATLTFVVAFFAKLAYFVRISGASWRDVLVLRYSDLPDAARLKVNALFGRTPA